MAQAGIMNLKVFFLGMGLFILLPGSSPAQEIDLKSLAERLDRLEKQNERLEKQNQELLQQIQQLKTPTEKGNPPPAPHVPEQKSPPAEKTSEKEKTAKEYVVGKNLHLEGDWKNGLWFETPDRAFRFKVGATTQFDMGWYGAADETVASIGAMNNLVEPGLALSDGMNFRRARLNFSGTIWEQVEFFGMYDFAQGLDLRRRTLGIDPAVSTLTDLEPAESVLFTEIYVGLIHMPGLDRIRIGRHRESLNFATATPAILYPWMERGLLFEAFNSDFNFSNGITLANNYLDNRVYSYFGFFQNNNRNFSAIGDGEYAYDVRFTGLPIWDEEEQRWLHLGIDYSYRNLHRGATRFRARPPVRTGISYQVPNVVNSGVIFSPDAQQIANLEFASAWGRWTFSAETAWSWVTNAYTGGLPANPAQLPPGVQARGTYIAQAAYVELLYFLTPDHRTYKLDRPGYDRVVPRRTFYFLDAEEAGTIWSSGAWEIGVRYDYLDLNSSGINGGLAQSVTFGLNWYLNPNTRVQTNYFLMNRSFSPEDRSARRNGDFHGLGIRFSLDF